MHASGKVRRWGYRCLLGIELTVIVLLLLGGCYSSQNYHVLSRQAGDELLNKCDIVVEGRISNVRPWNRTSWGQKIFFCWTFDQEPAGPARYNVSIEIDKVLKGDPLMQRQLQVNDCRPPTVQEANLLGQLSFPQDLPVRIGFNHSLGGKLRNLIVVPLPDSPTTQPNKQ